MPLPRPAALLNSSPIGVLRGLLTVLREPVFEGLLSAIWAFWKRGNAILGRVVRAEQEARAWAVRNDGDGSDGGGRGGGPLPLGEGMCVDFSASPDRSVGDEVRSLLGNGPAASKVVDNLVSAVVHGIYGGDVDALSAQACALTAGNRYFSAHRPLARGLALPLTNEPDENRASVAHGRARQNVPLLYVARKDLALARELRWTDAETGGRVTRLANALRAADMPILAFRGGMQTLTRRLEEELCAMGEERVRIIRGRRVTGLELVEGQDGEKVKVSSEQVIILGPRRERGDDQEFGGSAPGNSACELQISADSWHPGHVRGRCRPASVP